MSDKIIAMAKEAGLLRIGAQSGAKIWNAKYLSRFRDLVLEEAAAVCQARAVDIDEPTDWEAATCADLILALKGEQK